MSYPGNTSVDIHGPNTPASYNTVYSTSEAVNAASQVSSKPSIAEAAFAAFT